MATPTSEWKWKRPLSQLVLIGGALGLVFFLEPLFPRDVALLFDISNAGQPIDRIEFVVVDTAGEAFKGGTLSVESSSLPIEHRIRLRSGDYSIRVLFRGNGQLIERNTTLVVPSDRPLRISP